MRKPQAASQHVGSCALPQAAFWTQPLRGYSLKYVMRIFCIILVLLVGACGTTSDPVLTAQSWVGLSERQDRKQIREFVGVDPVRTEWCAAFVNAVLEVDGIPGSASVSDYPLMARSFLTWGEHVEPEDIQRGDVVIFPRGDRGWQGHVGFYVETQDGRWVILGGNQYNEVRYDFFKPRRAIAVRRYVEPTPSTNQATLDH